MPGIRQNLTVSGNFLYFTADDGVHGRELWKTNGTTTQMVADLSPGLNATTVSQMTDVGGKLFFTAATTTSVTTSPPGLFVTDGTTVTPLPDAVGSAQAAAFNGKLYFQGGSSDPVHGAELWVSDGTAAGTHLAADIDTQPGPGGTNLSSNPTGLTVFNGALYFAANDGIHGNELWKFDGTTASLVKDIDPVGTNLHNPANLTVAGNHLFFTADDGIHGVELSGDRRHLGRHSSRPGH